MKKLFLLSMSMLILTGCGTSIMDALDYEPCWDYKATNFEGYYYDTDVDPGDTSDCIYCHEIMPGTSGCCNIPSALNYNEDMFDWNNSFDSTYCEFE